MSTYSYDDDKFVNSSIFEDFMKGIKGKEQK